MSLMNLPVLFFFFFFNDTATTEIYTLSLHDALRSEDLEGRAAPIGFSVSGSLVPGSSSPYRLATQWIASYVRSEEHTSELQSQSNLLCRLLLGKKKKQAQRTLSFWLLSDPYRSPSC